MNFLLWLKQGLWAVLGLPRCDQLTALISQSMDRELRVKERLLLKFHCFICGYCTRYHEHLEHIRCSARTHELAAVDPCLSPESRNRMKRLLTEYDR